MTEPPAEGELDLEIGAYSQQNSVIQDPSVVPPHSYRDEKAGVYTPTKEERRIIDDVRHRFTDQEYDLYELQSIWYQISLFKHGLQYVNWSYEAGHPIQVGDHPQDHTKAVYNIMQAVQKQTESYFLDSPPKYTAMSLTQDGEDIEKSKTAEQVLEYFANEMHIPTLRSSAANWLTTLGNAVLYNGWDPMGGPMMNIDGRRIPRGTWACESVPLYQMVVDPNAKEALGSMGPRWVGRKRIMAMDWVRERYPNRADFVQDQDQISLDVLGSYELQWQNLSARHGYTNRGYSTMPEGRKSTLIMEMWEIPSTHHPQGRYIVMTSDNVLLHAGINPYGNDLPFSFIPMIRVEGAFWGRSTMLDLVYIQTEINRRESQKSQYCDLLGHPTLMHYEGDGLDHDTISNLIGEIIELNPSGYPAQPFFLRPPDMSPTVKEMVPEAMQFVDFISGNFGPSRGELSSKVNSGVQQMMIEEADARNMRPYMSDWEAGWEHFYKMGLRNFQKYATMPHKMQVMGSNGRHRLRYIQGTDIAQETDVLIVPGSSNPKSQTAVFTQMVSLLQAGAINMADPADAQKFWEALNMGDMVRIKSDKQLDLEKSLRNIDRIRSGQAALYDPITDDMNVHLSTVATFMKTAEFEQLEEPIKFMALLYRQMILSPLQHQMRAPMVPEGFPLFGQTGSETAPTRQVPPSQMVDQSQATPQ